MFTSQTNESCFYGQPILLRSGDHADLDEELRELRLWYPGAVLCSDRHLDIGQYVM